MDLGEQAVLGHVQRHLAGTDANARFESALRRLVGAYADPRG